MTTEPLDLKCHSVGRFSCGRPALDRWLREYAGQGQRRDTSRTFVAARADGGVVGYYTLVAGQVERDQATSTVRVGTSKRFPIPICLVARFAVDIGSQGRGLGAVLLLALDDEAARFYEHFSFMPISDEPRTLMVPLAAVRAVLDTAR